MNQDAYVLLFDGDCAACNSFIVWLNGLDCKMQFAFISLHGELGKKLLSAIGFPENYLDSIVILNDQNVFTNADAFYIGGNTGFPGSLLKLSRIVPSPIFKYFYRMIGQRRKFFKK